MQQATRSEKPKIALIKKGDTKAWKAANAAAAIKSMDEWQTRYQRPKGWVGKHKWD